MEKTEIELIEGIKEGKEWAFRKLFDMYYFQLYSIARQYLKDDFISETIVGDLFFHLWETRRSLNINTSLNAYLRRSIKNYSLNYLQKKTVKKEELQVVSEHLYSTGDYLLGELFEKELSVILNHEIEKLPVETKNVFILSRIEQFSNQEIAEKLGISVNTVKYHIKQFLSILRERLKDYLIIMLFFDFF